MEYDTYTADDFLMDDYFLAYCQGSDPAAVTFWETWQLSKPPNLAAFREAEQLHNRLSGHKPRLDDSLQELDALIRGRSQPTKIIPLAARPAGGLRWWVAAASVLLLSGLSWLGYQFWQNQYVTYETAYNQRRTVQLPDGSTVTLNSHSVLKHRRNGFSDDNRAVELEGEGFFAVRHMATHAPFRVSTNGAFAVEVLGTEFSVYSRPDRHRVVLNTGRVRVYADGNQSPVMLRPGQLIETNDRSRLVNPRNVQADHYNAWLRNQLVFDNTRLTEAIHTVEEQFGITVRIDGADIEQRTVTGILPINQPETALNALAALAQLNVRKTDTTFVLSKK